MAKITIEFETQYPEQVRDAYLVIVKLMEYHYPSKKDEQNTTTDKELPKAK